MCESSGDGLEAPPPDELWSVGFCKGRVRHRSCGGPYKKDMFFVFVLVQSIFYPPMYSTQSLRRSVICLSAGEAKARLLPLRKANRPSFGGGGTTGP